MIENTAEEFSKMVRAYDHEVLAGIKTVPWKNNQHEDGLRSIAGQDISLLKEHVDFFMPMTYSHLLEQEPEWINEILAEVHEATNKDVYATAQVEKVFPEQNSIKGAEFKKILQQSLKDPSQGIVIFHYLKSPDNSHKMQLLNSTMPYSRIVTDCD